MLIRGIDLVRIHHDDLVVTRTGRLRGMGCLTWLKLSNNKSLLGEGFVNTSS